MINKNRAWASEVSKVIHFIVSLSLAYLFWLPNSAFAEDYTFDISETQKKPYHLGGYAEFRPVLSGLDRDSALYKLKFYNRSEGETLEEYNAALQLEGSIEKGIAKLAIRTNTDYKKSYLGEDQETTVYESLLSIKPSSSLTIDIGKKTLKWGKGYAWNPVAFVDRPKDPDDPELSLEGFIVASADYIKSFDSPLKTISFTPVLIPVYDHVNDSFGDIDQLNFAGKIYLLLYDTDVDFIILAGGSRTTRYGADFSRNLTTSFEIHGEAAFINDFEKRFIDSSGNSFKKAYDAKSYLLGIRYLTEKETTYILEYYYNSAGFTSGEMRDYFKFIDKGYDSYISTGSDTLLKKASSITEGNYGRPNIMKDYIYFRASQKEPFDILYFTPSASMILNANDKSFSISPELLYTGITNLELRLKAYLLSGKHLSEYGEKPNDYGTELRVRYYF